MSLGSARRCDWAAGAGPARSDHAGRARLPGRHPGYRAPPSFGDVQRLLRPLVSTHASGSVSTTAMSSDATALHQTYSSRSSPQASSTHSHRQIVRDVRARETQLCGKFQQCNEWSAKAPFVAYSVTADAGDGRFRGGGQLATRGRHASVPSNSRCGPGYHGAIDRLFLRCWGGDKVWGGSNSRLR